MSFDFTYGNSTINSSGGFIPTKKNAPTNPREVVDTYADIANIPNPYVGLTVTVKADETNNNKMTDYKVISLKSNNLGIADMLIDQVQRMDEYLGVLKEVPAEYVTETEMNEAIANVSSGGSVSQEDINTAVNNYFTEHPVSSGATAEQAAQIQANKTAIGDENSGLIKKVNDIENTELQNLNSTVQNLETLIGNKSELPGGDRNIIASIKRIDSKTTSGGTTTENTSKLANKKWLVIGDSISDKNITATSKWYFDYIAENTGIIPVNDGRSGSGYSKNSSGIAKNVKIPDRISQLPTDVDVITILAGINDCGTNGTPTELGTIEDSTTTTFYGAVNVTISLIKAKYPETPFGIISFLPYYDSGAVQQARVDALEAVCKANFIPFLNLYNSCGFYIKDNNFKSSFVPDGIHPNEYGHARLAPKIQQFLEYITDEYFEATYGGIVVSTNSLTVNEGETATFKVKLDAQPSNSQNVTITINNTNCSSDVSYLTFTSSNYNVEQTVRITGYHDTSTLENLTSVITLSTRNSSATINCTITNIDEAISQTRVESVTLTDETIELTTSSTKQLTYTITPSNANNKNVSFVSSAPEIVSVSSGGLITALTAGEATITITTEDGNFQDTVTVTVTEPVSWVGKTLTVTKNHNFGDFATIPLLFKNKDTFTKNSKVQVEFEGINATNMTTCTNDVPTPLYATNEPTISDSTATNINGNHVSATQTVTEDGRLTVTYPEYTLGNANITKYSYFILTLTIYGTVNYSMQISKLKITIDGEEQPILDIKPLNMRTAFTIE